MDTVLAPVLNGNVSLGKLELPVFKRGGEGECVKTYKTPYKDQGNQSGHFKIWQRKDENVVRTLSNARDHRALRRYCLRNHHATMGHIGSGVLWKIIVTQHSPPLHPEMKLEIVLCKEEGIK